MTKRGKEVSATAPPAESPLKKLFDAAPADFNWNAALEQIQHHAETHRKRALSIAHHEDLRRGSIVVYGVLDAAAAAITAGLRKRQ